MAATKLATLFKLCFGLVIYLFALPFKSMWRAFPVWVFSGEIYTQAGGRGLFRTPTLITLTTPRTFLDPLRCQLFQMRIPYRPLLDFLFGVIAWSWLGWRATGVQRKNILEANIPCHHQLSIRSPTDRLIDRLTEPIRFFMMQAVLTVGCACAICHSFTSGLLTM